MFEELNMKKFVKSALALSLLSLLLSGCGKKDNAENNEKDPTPSGENEDNKGNEENKPGKELTGYEKFSNLEFPTEDEIKSHRKLKATSVYTSGDYVNKETTIFDYSVPGNSYVYSTLNRDGNVIDIYGLNGNANLLLRETYNDEYSFTLLNSECIDYPEYQSITDIDSIHFLINKFTEFDLFEMVKHFNNFHNIDTFKFNDLDASDIASISETFFKDTTYEFTNNSSTFILDTSLEMFKEGEEVPHFHLEVSYNLEVLLSSIEFSYEFKDVEYSIEFAFNYENIGDRVRLIDYVDLVDEEPSLLHVYGNTLGVEGIETLSANEFKSAFSSVPYKEAQYHPAVYQNGGYAGYSENNFIQGEFEYYGCFYEGKEVAGYSYTDSNIVEPKKGSFHKEGETTIKVTDVDEKGKFYFKNTEDIKNCYRYDGNLGSEYFVWSLKSILNIADTAPNYFEYLKITLGGEPLYCARPMSYINNNYGEVYFFFDENGDLIYSLDVYVELDKIDFASICCIASEVQYLNSSDTSGLMDEDDILRMLNS